MGWPKDGERAVWQQNLFMPVVVVFDLNYCFKMFGDVDLVALTSQPAAVCSAVGNPISLTFSHTTYYFISAMIFHKTGKSISAGTLPWSAGDQHSIKYSQHQGQPVLIQ